MAESLAAQWPRRRGLPPGWRLELFNSWVLLHSRSLVTMGLRERRLLALLALDGARARSYLAGMLWPNSSEHHANASLRASLSLIHRVSPGLVAVHGEALSLDADMAVDVDEFHRCTSQIAIDADTVDPFSAVEQLKRADLLPGWYDDWVVVERERMHQLRVRALESLAEVLLGRDTGLALVAAMAAVRLDPLRDRAHRALLRVHLADGNVVEAVRHYESFRTDLRREMGLAPSQATRGLIRPLLDAMDLPQAANEGRLTIRHG
jgi:DNA-binding SARP family transcriptional activator